MVDAHMDKQSVNTTTAACGERRSALFYENLKFGMVPFVHNLILLFVKKILALQMIKLYNGSISMEE